MTSTSAHSHGLVPRLRMALAGVVIVACALLPATAWSDSLNGSIPEEMEGVGVNEHLGDYADLDAEFIDHNGKTVTLRDYLDDDMPVILTLNYYQCQMLCNLQLNGLVDALESLDWTVGENFRIVTISIDPREEWELGKAKRDSYLEEYGRGDVEWAFLTAKASQSQRIADSVGFTYKYDDRLDQYAHISVLTFLAPDGKITRYLYGLKYRPFDLKMAVQEASDGTVGDPLERVIFSCFHYDPETGEYSLWAFGVMRLGAAVTAVALAFFLAFMFWRESRRRRDEDALGSHLS